jgi:hypothetical protein
MTTDRIDAIKSLLIQAEKAHGAYEASELKGVYDEDWPRWYAGYAVDHGVRVMLGHDVTTDELARFLALSYAEFQQAEPKPSEPWPAYTARRLVTEL